MNQDAAISAVYRALAHYRRRQANNPSDHSAREIVQMSMLAEYLHETRNASRPACNTDRVTPESLPAWKAPQARSRLQSNHAA